MHMYIHYTCMPTCTCSVKSCPTLCDPMDNSLLGSSVYGISQARILVWLAISFSMFARPCVFVIAIVEFSEFIEVFYYKYWAFVWWLTKTIDSLSQSDLQDFDIHTVLGQWFLENYCSQVNFNKVDFKKRKIKGSIEISLLSPVNWINITKPLKVNISERIFNMNLLLPLMFRGKLLIKYGIHLCNIE